MNVIGSVSALLLVAWLLPNTNQLLSRFQPTLEYVPRDGIRPPPLDPRWAEQWLWRPRAGWAWALAALAILAVLGLSRISEFIYWQF